MSSTVRPVVAKANYEEIMKLAGAPHNLLGFNYALQTVLKMVKISLSLVPSESKNEFKGENGKNEFVKGFDEGGTND